MNWDNIPEGYDENGVRGGFGKWSDDEEEVDIDIDQFEAPDTDDYVKCNNCGGIITRDIAINIPKGTGFLCPECSTEEELYKMSSR